MNTPPAPTVRLRLIGQGRIAKNFKRAGLDIRPAAAGIAAAEDQRAGTRQRQAAGPGQRSTVAIRERGIDLDRCARIGQADVSAISEAAGNFQRRRANRHAATGRPDAGNVGYHQRTIAERGIAAVSVAAAEQQGAAADLVEAATP